MGLFAAQNGVRAAARHFALQLGHPVNISTVFKYKRKYLQTLEIEAPHNPRVWVLPPEQGSSGVMPLSKYPTEQSAPLAGDSILHTNSTSFRDVVKAEPDFQR